MLHVLDGLSGRLREVPARQARLFILVHCRPSSTILGEMRCRHHTCAANATAAYLNEKLHVVMKPVTKVTGARLIR